ncbi:hypothetical protein IOK49_02635 [Fervidicoccus fontis]|uniref:Uncharacterized protein n=1 Tax=Fervidicoccus fontis TaxID=683846 RepID=A0A843A8E3_9CREN|nr:hypothetical protein [Fervidicoccus fontis]MBE9390975.1 hypothetical protein [Fervidicoccus fontis]
MICEPYVLYYGGNFFNKMRKVYSIGILDRPLPKIFGRYGESAELLDREDAVELLNTAKEKSGITTSDAQIVKNMIEALFLPTSLIYSYFKKLSFSEAAETDEFFIMEFMGSQAKPMKFTPLIVYMWFVIPKSENGCRKSVELMRKIKQEVGTPPISKEEWEELKPLIEKFSRALPIQGSSKNLWDEI